VAYFATTAAMKLRKDGSVASSLCVFVRTNPFKENEVQYQRSVVVPLSRPSADTAKIVSAALAGLKQVFRAGFRYKKSGVLLMGLQGKDTVQADLFDQPMDQTKSEARMMIMDQINLKMGKGAITIAATGVKQRWSMRRERKSPNYTGDWHELLEVD
jgi:DNA polymerase V